MIELPGVDFQVVLTAALLFLIIWIAWIAIQKVVFALSSSDLDNLQGPPSDSFLKEFFFPPSSGHLRQLAGPNAADFHKEVLRNYGQIARIKFPLGRTRILVSDPKALHYIMVKDQNIYRVPNWAINSTRILFGPGLLGTLGETHRKQRKMLNPAFSIAHMRDIVPVFYGVTRKLRDAIAKKVTLKDGPQEIDIMPWLARTALELIGQSGFGYSFDSLTDDGDGVAHSYALSVKQVAPVLSKLLFPRIYLLPILSKIGTKKVRRFMVEHFPWRAVRDMARYVNVIHRTSLEIFDSKKRALVEGNEEIEDDVARGKDLMSVLLHANMQAEKEDRLSDEEFIGQVSTFTFAATETTSSALCRILWVLSERQDAQDKLRMEIREARKQHGDFSYDVLNGLPYLDSILRETLRLYAPLAGLFRRAQTAAVLPLGTPITGRDGRVMSEILVPKGTDIVVSILGCNTNPEIWGSDSYEWKPERWLEPLPDTVTNARIPGVYSNLMTFNGGGRACIGFKFSQLEMKVALSLLIDTFKVTRSNKEVYWRTQAVATPFVKGDRMERPNLPLVFEA